MSRAKRNNNDSSKINSSQPVEASSIGKNTTSWKTLILIILPGCIYFFGYSSRVYFLNAVGFSSPSIPIDVGSAYLHAYHGLIFTANLALSDFTTKYINQIHEGWLTTFTASLIMGVAIIIIGLWLVRNSKKETRKSNPKDKSLSKSERPVTIKKLFLLSGTGIAAVNLLTFLLLPIFVAILILPTLFLIIPAALGARMGTEEIKSFSCKQDQNDRYLPCATIEFRDKTQLTGRIYLRNEGIIYVRTTEAAMEIPESDVTKVFRTDLKTSNISPSTNSSL